MEILFKIYIFVFGLMIGSFLNVVILRLPKKKDLVFTRSACLKCGTSLKWYHNIPLFSFLVLRGKCAFCKTPISWRYPLIELFTALAALWIAPDTYELGHVGIFIFYFTIACIFICHFVIDLEHHLLLDSLNIYLLCLFLTYSIFNHHWQFWLLGGLVGFLVPLSVTWAFYKLRGQIGLGGGDIKLFGVLGLFVGPTGVMFTIFLSCFVGAILGIALILSKKITRDKPMAFGPAILLVAAFQIFFPQYAAIVRSWFF